MCGRRRDGGAGIVRADGDDGDLPDAEFLRHGGGDAPVGVARFDEFGQDRCRNAEFFEEFGIPLTRYRVQEIRGRGVGALDALFPGEEIREEVGNHQNLVRQGKELRLVVGKIIELIEGIEVHRLNPGAAVNLLFGENAEHFFRNVMRARVAVVDGVREEFAVLRNQPEVHAPGVDADGVDVLARRAEFIERLLDLEP